MPSVLLRRLLAALVLMPLAAFAQDAGAPAPAAPAAPVLDHGTTAWMLVSTALVLMMVPGLAMFYGGLVRTKNVIGTMMHSFVAMAIIGVLWTVFGYALCFGDGILGGLIGWKKEFFCLMGIDEAITPYGVPEYVIAMFQGKFAIITPALISGAIAERVYFRGYCLFIALWFLTVYCPLCHWVWGPGGWLLEKGVIDLAGGTVIHVSAGTSALVICLLLGARRGYPKSAMHPNNLVMTLMGAGLLWTGWFGFNAGSTVQSGMDTARALTMTQVSAASGAFTWTLIEAFLFRKVTSLGFVSGILAGLVVITPAAGVVHVAGALALGALSAGLCFLALRAKNKFGYDDSLDCFGVHGVGSGLGVLLLPFFLRSGWVADKVKADPSWTIGGQFLTQLLAVGVVIALSAVMTWIIWLLLEKTVGFRLDEAREKAGMDHSLHGEHGYGLMNLN
jgi:ammonium transporter, Amt family